MKKISLNDEPLIQRVFARANCHTFKIPPITDLLKLYVGNGKGWVDPFAGWNSPAEYTNDLNPDAPTKYHLDALKFCKRINKKIQGVLFDPPYSYRQISEHYKKAGLPVTGLDTSYNFYNRVMCAISPKIKIGGYAISFGWNSNGFGYKKGFEKADLLVVAHGQHHNDTLCLVERKLKEGVYK